ncbi:MAG: M20/M25/M40 family metallo-hydrolase, partial [Acidobacteria bacterium]|nr:M20/M25/M40 family metallo-hydrolase [Acidobacteriota bacterium]
SEGLLQLMTMIILARERAPLSRDVIFLATADEEVKDEGSIWMIANKADLFKNAEYLLTEGGDNLLAEGKVKFVGIDVAEKAPLWLQLKATGQPGHGSRPIADSAPNRLVRAMARVLAYEPPIKLLPAVEKFFKDVAPLQPEPMRSKFANIRESLKDSDFARDLAGQREYGYLLRNTISLTMMSGGKQTNVVPNEATCDLDVRLLPGEKPEEFLAALKRVIDDPRIQIENTNTFKPPNSSSGETELFQIITIYTTTEENAGVHGNNERITVKNVREGTREFYEVVSQIAR